MNFTEEEEEEEESRMKSYTRITDPCLTILRCVLPCILVLGSCFSSDLWWETLVRSQRKDVFQVCVCVCVWSPVNGFLIGIISSGVHETTSPEPFITLKKPCKDGTNANCSALHFDFVEATTKKCFKISQVSDRISVRSCSVNKSWQQNN